MKGNYSTAKMSRHASKKEAPRFLGRLLSHEVTQKISAGHSPGDMVCTGTQKGDKVRVDCTLY
ncbi:MAG: hypothetical protein AB7D28_05610 [Candidatus Berkiella sp.]